jgi:hypothetical protein
MRSADRPPGARSRPLCLYTMYMALRKDVQSADGTAGQLRRKRSRSRSWFSPCYGADVARQLPRTHAQQGARAARGRTDLDTHVLARTGEGRVRVEERRVRDGDARHDGTDRHRHHKQPLLVPRAQRPPPPRPHPPLLQTVVCDCDRAGATMAAGSAALGSRLRLASLMQVAPSFGTWHGSSTWQTRRGFVC